MTDDRILLGRRIRARREAAGFRQQKDFARSLGISQSDLSRIERGLRRVDTILLRRIADALGTTMDSFFPRAHDAGVTTLARKGDADDASMKQMIDWATRLRADIDRVAEYRSGRAL